MKKIIALALALVMALSMASVAFAAPVVPTTVTPATTQRPGESYKFGIEAFTGATDVLKVENFSVSADWEKGGAMVESVTIGKKDDAGKVIIKLKENYTITDEKTLKGTLTFTAKADGVKIDGVTAVKKGDKIDVKFTAVVANDVEYVFGEKKADDCIAKDADNNKLYICDEDTPGYVKFNVGALMGVTLNMAAKEKAFMYQIENDADLMDELEEKYPDAEIETYTFGGQPTFKNAAEITLQADYADQYFIYAYDGKKLTEVEGVEWDSIEGVYKWETKSPKTYVIADEELVAAAEEEAETKNPDTGANDVVGVAAALAVVSLVAAGAVSLKK